MGNLDWGMIGAIATIGSVLVTIIIAIIQGRKPKNQQESSKQNNQVIKGLFISKNEINQNNK
ncbi:hypothetical protein CBC_A0929 [Clostridium botulinum C str. Eklund]|nr:hypothetical protein CBC_A0929 [Clostridium botulinum C str. Eklund]NEZ49319.1 hypothetical protein [Clostridium botulinum]